MFFPEKMLWAELVQRASLQDVLRCPRDGQGRYVKVACSRSPAERTDIRCLPHRPGSSSGSDSERYSPKPMRMPSTLLAVIPPKTGPFATASMDWA